MGDGEIILGMGMMICNESSWLVHSHQISTADGLVLQNTWQARWLVRGLDYPSYVGDYSNPCTGNIYLYYKPTRIKWNDDRGMLNTAQICSNGISPFWGLRDMYWTAIKSVWGEILLGMGMMMMKHAGGNGKISCFFLGFNGLSMDCLEYLRVRAPLGQWVKKKQWQVEYLWTPTILDGIVWLIYGL